MTGSTVGSILTLVVQIDICFSTNFTVTKECLRSISIMSPLVNIVDETQPKIHIFHNKSVFLFNVT